MSIGGQSGRSTRSKQRKRNTIAPKKWNEEPVPDEFFAKALEGPASKNPLVRALIMKARQKAAVQRGIFDGTLDIFEVALSGPAGKNPLVRALIMKTQRKDREEKARKAAEEAALKQKQEEEKSPVVIEEEKSPAYEELKIDTENTFRDMKTDGI